MTDEKYVQVLQQNPELPRHPDFLNSEFPISRDFKIEIEIKEIQKEVSAEIEDVKQIQLVFEQSEVKADSHN